jgi:acetylornithine deacetylase/succinyl-diaminopimelate desuccinylase-like protein
VYGKEPLYTPFIERPYDAASEPNAILRAVPLLTRLEAWALDYERRFRYECPGGTVVPRVNVGAIRGGHPTMVLQSPEVCVLYLDVRTIPDQDSGAIQTELEGLLRELGLEGRVEQFLNRSGFEAKGIEPLLEALDEAHGEVVEAPPAIAQSETCSMWRDHNIFNEMNIPALTYGPTGLVGGGKFEMRIDDIADAARVYALTALNLCGAVD